MRVEVQPCEVRRLVLAIFQQLGVQRKDPLGLEENVLIQEGRYAARSYWAEPLMAMWLVDVGLVQFYDDEGNMLRTVNLGEEFAPLKIAA